ncbi:MAG: pseudouridine synthase [Acidobacteriia bacterium]|nr:pseudouridine synthase [Terriglobia bacterium]MYG02801.1 pseudouridine synthase [Terriglobia bacterium]MYK10580.1 pseudouridine synthase [Terriglobia bacterium]
MSERLQKIIARAGIASRRKAEELILSGRVSVNGEVATQLGSRADVANDTVRVDGKVLRDSGTRRYLAMHKPKGCVTTTDDPEGRPTVMDLLGAGAAKGLHPVGRLDYNTEGLLILTDDGDFSNELLSAKNRIPKTYAVKVSGFPPEEAIQKLRQGIRLDGRLARPESIRLVRQADNPWFEVTLTQGRNRQIHRMFERIGFLVEKIRRVRIGSLSLKGLEPRQVRELLPKEVERLRNYEPSAERDRREFEPEAERRPRGAVRRSVNLPGEKRFGRGRAARPGGGGRDARRTPRGSASGRPPRARSFRSDSKPSRRDSDDWSGGREPRRGNSRTNRLRREARPQQRPERRRPSGANSPARARTGGRAGSPGRSPMRSRGPRSSRPGSRARP